MENDTKLYLTVQNLAEFWNAATRPVANNGLRLTIEEAKEELSKLEGFFEVLTENAESYEEWKTLLSAHRVTVFKCTMRDSLRLCGPAPLLQY